MQSSLSALKGLLSCTALAVHIKRLGNCFSVHILTPPNSWNRNVHFDFLTGDLCLWKICTKTLLHLLLCLFFPMSQNSMIREHPGLGTHTAGVYAPRDKLESGTCPFRGTCGQQGAYYFMKCRQTQSFLQPISYDVWPAFQALPIVHENSLPLCLPAADVWDILRIIRVPKPCFFLYPTWVARESSTVAGWHMGERRGKKPPWRPAAIFSKPQPPSREPAPTPTPSTPTIATTFLWDYNLLQPKQLQLCGARASLEAKENIRRWRKAISEGKITTSHPSSPLLYSQVLFCHLCYTSPLWTLPSRTLFLGVLTLLAPTYLRQLTSSGPPQMLPLPWKVP